MKDSTTDRELLELAAKAAGLALNGEHSWRGVALQDGPHTYWNPLTDDGDALRLAAELSLSIGTNMTGSDVVADTGFGCDAVFDPMCGDKSAAWRRAITRCAAKIGRSHHG